MEMMEERIHPQSNGRSLLNKEGGATPVVGEVVLVVGDKKNRGEWKKGKVTRLIQGKDGVVRGVVLLHKGHTIETSSVSLSTGDTRSGLRCSPARGEERRSAAEEPQSAETCSPTSS